jgi:hypothetical protein
MSPEEPSQSLVVTERREGWIEGDVAPKLNLQLW